MKNKLFIMCLILVSSVACSPTSEEKSKSFIDEVDSYISCGWSSQYNACFCGMSLGSRSGLFTYVPDKVCGK